MEPDFIKFIVRSAAMHSKFDFIRARIDEYVSPFSPTKTNLKQFLNENEIEHCIIYDTFELRVVSHGADQSLYFDTKRKIVVKSYSFDGNIDHEMELVSEQFAYF